MKTKKSWKDKVSDSKDLPKVKVIREPLMAFENRSQKSIILYEH